MIFHTKHNVCLFPHGIRRALLVAYPLVCCLSTNEAAAEPTISFDRDIRPILSENCFHCHGPDSENREADLGLHDAKLAMSVIEPEDPEASELVHRIFDDDQPMPPLSSNRKLTAIQKKLLRQWIAEGAEYQAHWAFIPPKKVSPSVRDGDHELKAGRLRPVNPIDGFVQARLAKEGLEFAPEARPHVLARRVSLALTGLHPTASQGKQFLADTSADAYEQFVDRLLDSDGYAERMTLYWLDAARYADTDGYQNDAQRTNWPWRDWVIAAYRDNMPFDQFTIEQLAGDMLPEATDSQRLATAFNRNHRQNGESGALSEEFFVENVIDRVETTSTVWLGLTTGCARCHDHKYDPISQREFYQLFAYFNNIGERGIGMGIKANPLLEIASPIRKMPQELAEQEGLAESKVTEARRTIIERMDDWFREYPMTDLFSEEGWNYFEQTHPVTVVLDRGGQDLLPQSDGSYRFEKYSSERVAYLFEFEISNESITGLRLEILPNQQFSDSPQFAPSNNGNFVVTDLALEVQRDTRRKDSIEIARVVANYEQVGYPAAHAIDDERDTGWAVDGADTEQPLQLIMEFKEPLRVDPSGTLKLTIQQNSPFPNHTIGQLRVSYTTHDTPIGPPDEVIAALRSPAEQWTASARESVSDYYESIDPVLQRALKAQQATELTIEQAGYGIATVMVMQEQEKAYPAYLLNRGQYDDPDKSEVLHRTVPSAILLDYPPPSDRLELARWLTSRDNPLTARVVVNRMWQHMFGVGLVKTSEDFGAQGERPSHPELLDWLAVEFIDSGWDVQHIFRLIATSRTFRQSSRATIAAHTKDPNNRLLARGARFRMDGFALRDMALQSAGLLNSEIGGPPVKPYQPAGLWSAVGNSANDRYVRDRGEKLYRKSLYTYWRRAVNPPRQTIFDASGREVCNVRHRVTNTPLQALALMNDETFVEAARHLGERMLKEGGDTAKQRLTFGYQSATSYEPDASQLEVLLNNLQYFKKHYAHHPQEAADFLSVGESARDESLSVAEHAAYAATAHLLLNLDETIVLE